VIDEIIPVFVVSCVVTPQPSLQNLQNVNAEDSLKPAAQVFCRTEASNRNNLGVTL